MLQDKDKYNTPKYRLVARITNNRVIAQVVYATIKGDKVFCSADSQELKRFGLTAGLANYASAYATGLLLARRLLKSVKLDETYPGNKEIAKDYKVETEEKDRRPFKLILDVGLKATTTGSKVFAVLKGAADGGAHVPHDTSRFPGKPDPKKKDNEKKRGEMLRQRILGAHIDEYMKKIKGTAKESLQFSQWNECLKKSGAGSV